MTIYRAVVRPALFRLSRSDPERAHELAMALLAALNRTDQVAAAAQLLAGPAVRDSALEQSLFGRRFPNPVGLAAGFDKNALAPRALAALGFGFLELGTVTRLAQPGNPRPRLARAPEAAALINRMGFNNDGAAALAARLQRYGGLGVPVGVSLGKSKTTPLAQAVDDYRASARLLAPLAGYLAVNVSSPNTPGLRALQEREAVDALLGALLKETAARRSPEGRQPPPLLVKVSPDLTNAALGDLLDVCLARGVDGIIAVNTTTARPARHAADPRWQQAGGLSGRPLRARAIAVVRFIHQESGGRLPIIGVGGISSGADAYAMLRAGASLVQLYTAFIYQGPGIARRINRELLDLLRRDGVRRLADLPRGGRHEPVV